MTTQHTPGPWTVQKLETRHNGYDWSTFAVRSPRNICLAVIGEIDRFESERIPANARLIAAAPDMLAALQFVLPSLRGAYAEDSDWSGDVAKVEAAIARATNS